MCTKHNTLRHIHRKHTLGVLLRSFIQGTLLFAGHMALSIRDKASARKYIEVLEKWCQESFFEVGIKDSGMLVGNIRQSDIPNIKIKDTQIHLLEENDSNIGKDEILHFKCLRIHLPPY